MSTITLVQKFEVEVNGKLKSFNSEAEARQALARVELEAEVHAKLTAMGVAPESKMFAGKANVILDFLSFTTPEADEAQTEA